MERNFVLGPFLLSLKSYGIRPAADDYTRIHAVLRTRNVWTRARVRDALAALLTRDSDQQAGFIRRFDDFFDLKPGSDALDAQAVDVSRALDELRQLLCDEQRRPADKQTTASRAVSGKTPEKTPPKRPAKRIFLLSLLLAAAIFAVIYTWPKTPRLCEPPAELSFHAQAPNGQATRTLELKNCGSAPLRLHQAEADQPAFLLQPRIDGRTLAPGKKILLSIRFHPEEVRQYRGELRLRHNGEKRRHRIDLHGVGAEPPSPAKKEPEKRLYKNVPYVRDVAFTPASSDTRWRTPALGAAALLPLLLLALRRRRTIQPAPCNPRKPGRFRIGKAGGPRPSCLDEARADEIAETLGYYQTERPGHILDVSASLHATLDNQGVPSLVFHRLKRVRGMLILEDAFAEARLWNPIARELAAALPGRGIPVLYGSFQNNPLQFRDADNRPYHLEDLEEQEYLLLIFTDGKTIGPGFPEPILEELSHWPQIAWMDLREPRAWDRSVRLPGQVHIPLYPATPQGVLDAARYYLSESLGRAAAPLPALPRVGLEQHLGDALAWAQDCALLHPVLPLGLAENLRARFHSHLPIQAVERLHTLPGTVQTAAGLRFSDPVRKALRRGSIARREPGERDRALAFLLAEVDKAKPKGEKDSLTILAWELAKEKIRFESDPDNDCTRLAQLEKVPALQGAVRDWLKDFQETGTPFCRVPDNKTARLQLAGFAGNPFGLPRFSSAGILATLLLCAALAGWSAKLWLEREVPRSSWEWEIDANLDANLTLAWQENTAFPEAFANFHLLAALPRMPAQAEYRFHLFGNARHTVSDPHSLEQAGEYRILAGVKQVEAPCREILEEGLEIIRCASFPEEGQQAQKGTAGLEKTFRENFAWVTRAGKKNLPKGPRLFSVGVEIGNGDPVFRNLLLQTASVDAVYRIDSFSETTLARLREETVLAHTQAVLWSTGDDIQARTVVVRLLEKFSRFLDLGVLSSPARLRAAKKLFKPGAERLVREEEIIAALKLDAAVGEGDPMLLLRPLAVTATLVFHIAPSHARLQVRRAGESAWSDTDGGEIEAGAWEARASAKGYEAAQKTFAARAGREAVLEFNLKPVSLKAFAVQIRTQPAGATLVLNSGKSVRKGAGGDIFSLSPAIWRIAATLPGYQDADHILDLRKAEKTPAPLLLTLQPGTFTFMVEAIPEDARVRIMNIRPVYRPGIELKTGLYDIEVSKTGYRTWRQKIKLREDTVLPVKLEMKPMLWVEVKPASATLRLYDNNLETVRELQSGKSVELPVGHWRLMASAPGYEHEEQILTLAAGETRKLTLRLMPKTEQTIEPSYQPSNIWRKIIAGAEFKFSFIKGGRFRIGCHERARECYDDEKPARTVQVGDFYLSQTEVTQGQWKAVMGNNPSYFKKGDNYPVENVRWRDARKFIAKLNKLTDNRYGFRLPAEAEWEYAARNGGEKITYPWGDEAPVCRKGAKNGANFSDCTGSGTRPVKSYAPNKQGLYDMAGNVWEWTCSEYENKYQGEEIKCISNNRVNADRVVRGGSWSSYARWARVFSRYGWTPNARANTIGFRLVRIE
ncbi:MAG: SUMF1/EgtB/PvdO family nonheme iron enzyme [Gammaproteobacteria bacterium]|nr:SUMF1/EgtB/PvdO family nonheme iron enzyme [Gammaproteobacteria bacterium]